MTSDPDIAVLAEAAGLQVDWVDANGAHHRVTAPALERILTTLGYPCETATQRTDALERIRSEQDGGPEGGLFTAVAGRPIRLPIAAGGAANCRLELESGARLEPPLHLDGRHLILPAVSEPGYHHLEIDGRRETLAVAPARAFGLEDVAPGRRLWGAAAQIYSLRGEAGPAFGGFAEVASDAESLAAFGADALAISPAHALYAANPAHYGPYSPSSRLFLNSLYADPRVALGADFVAACDPPPRDGQDALLIDWLRAGSARLAWLRGLFQRARAALPASRWDDFTRFRADGGAPLQRHAQFEALHGRFLAADGVSDWRAWPAAYQDPGSPQVRAFASECATEIEFHAFLQWLAETSLAEAKRRASQAGMAVGLIADLAVGVDPGGSQAWSRGEEMLRGLTIGAPPDPFSAEGQGWGVTTFAPDGLHRSGFAGFIETLRACLRGVGGLRIDHVLGLRRLWVIPDGCTPDEGAYLRYPETDLLRLIALESHRAQAIILGEDLGTVPEGLREVLEEASVLGLRVLLFERGASGRFHPPEAWTREAAAMTTTHDLPTIAGWWRERDIDMRLEPDQAGTGEAVARAVRAADRDHLWRAGVDAGVTTGPLPAKEDPAPAVDAAIDLVAISSCRVALVPLEDLLGLEDQPNVPGDVSRFPNWRRRLPAGGLDRPVVKARAARLTNLRAGG